MLRGRIADELELGELDPQAARAVLRDSPLELASEAAEQILAAAVGNPLALRELPRMLTEDQRRGRAPLAPLPAPDGALGEAFSQRAAAAGTDARRALLVAAASSSDTLTPVVAACRELGIPVGALEDAEGSGLVALGTDTIAFTHPLLRAVVYQGAPPADRRHAHRALANHTDEDARAWHLAAAAVGPDPLVAATLDQAAARATARGAHSVAGYDDARGALDGASPLLAEVDPLTPAAQSIAFAFSGRHCLGQEAEMRRELGTLVASAREAGSTTLRRYAQLLLSDSAFGLGDWEAAERAAEEAVAIADDFGKGGPLSIALVMRGQVHAAKGEESEARAAVGWALRIADPPGYLGATIRARAVLGFLELGLGRTEAAVDELEETARIASESGLEDPLRVPFSRRTSWRHTCESSAWTTPGRSPPISRPGPGRAQRASRAASPSVARAWWRRVTSSVASSARWRICATPGRGSRWAAASWRLARACTAGANAQRHASGYGPPSTYSSGSGQRRGPRAPRRSCEPPARGGGEPLTPTISRPRRCG